ncbi:diaminohydroxyphosphoribosylaminopyrimidine deaminase [Pontibacillus halophilus JSM 076056 = DSM 19796]|uniref:Diaminohydroxyphosphoribosylaminopyrimidine deaminase n=1 Tax=Pontibacillus halophilus JSM 076056 = DSM 19796 TaxID=1385510 RepID=A0A0A5I4J0_9BACI|nr:NAD-dependent epimerase/dehydratase family protein [Pontibacillus halophilus]KGX90742.1 diaminohydroxyphosphoribosylaminopyrimidine deaminase [Pontibacillus halophilus JSM 076056 = DSM 19796]
MDKTTVLVTGGTGYMASWLVKDLLELGHDVRVTVRNKKKVSKYQHLLDLAEEAEGQLSIYEADLLKKGSFNKAVQGSEYVFHTASPFFISGFKDPYKELVRPAKEGTINVINAVNEASSVKRVVLTSSAVAIFGDNCDLAGKIAFTERDWNKTSTVDHNPYSYSKTLAEREAWKMAHSQERWDLVTINPTLIVGPSLSKRTDSTSITMIRDLLTGQYKTGVPSLINGTVDVRDVAKAHILAAFTKQATGRYLLSGREASMLEMAQIIEKNFPNEHALPKREVPKAVIWAIAPKVGLTRTYVKRNVGHHTKFDHSKSVAELQLNYRSLETTLVDQKKQLEADQYL